jgi:hypothetical protein
MQAKDSEIVKEAIQQIERLQERFTCNAIWCSAYIAYGESSTTMRECIARADLLEKEYSIFARREKTPPFWNSSDRITYLQDRIDMLTAFVRHLENLGR